MSLLVGGHRFFRFGRDNVRVSRECQEGRMEGNRERAVPTTRCDKSREDLVHGSFRTARPTPTPTPARLFFFHQLDPSGPAAGYNPVHVFSPIYLRCELCRVLRPARRSPLAAKADDHTG